MRTSMTVAWRSRVQSWLQSYRPRRGGGGGGGAGDRGRAGGGRGERGEGRGGGGAGDGDEGEGRGEGGGGAGDLQVNNGAMSASTGYSALQPLLPRRRSNNMLLAPGMAHRRSRRHSSVRFHS